MSRLWVIAVAITIAAIGVSILVHGFVSGGWLWGLLFGTFTGAALYEWLTLRTIDDSARHVADRMIVLMLLLLAELGRRFLVGTE